jgi:hypothetical protein
MTIPSFTEDGIGSGKSKSLQISETEFRRVNGVDYFEYEPKPVTK